MLTLCKYYHWPPDFWRRLGRREFYHIVDETYQQTERQSSQRVGSWKGYDQDPWYQDAKRKTGRV